MAIRLSYKKIVLFQKFDAETFTSSQVLGKKVEVREIDVDRYGRIVGLVSAGDLVLNRHLVAYGYAWVYHQYCKKPFCSEWSKVEAQARREKKGLWKNPNVIPPWEYRRAKRKKDHNSQREALHRQDATAQGILCNCSDFSSQAGQS